MLNEVVVYSQRLALQVERYHTWPKLRAQSVGEHTAQLMRIYCVLFGPPPTHVWVHMLQHDMPEMRIGDLPFSGEFAPELKAAKAAVEQRVAKYMGLASGDEMTPTERYRVKLCDLMDCYEWGVHEARMGNAYGTLVSQNVYEPIVALAKQLECESDVLRHMTVVSQHP